MARERFFLSNYGIHPYSADDFTMKLAYYLLLIKEHNISEKNYRRRRVDIKVIENLRQKESI